MAKKDIEKTEASKTEDEVETEDSKTEDEVETKAPLTEDEVEIEYDIDMPNFMVANRISSEEYTDKLWAMYEAEKPVRDAVQAKREKVLQELLGLGLSEGSARFLAQLEE